MLKESQVREAPESAHSQAWNWTMVLPLTLDHRAALGGHTPMPNTGFRHNLAVPRLQPRPRTRGRMAWGWGKKLGMGMEGMQVPSQDPHHQNSCNNP